MNTKQKAQEYARQKWPDLDLSQSENRLFRAFSLEEVIAFAEEFAEQEPYNIEQMREAITEIVHDVFKMDTKPSDAIAELIELFEKYKSKEDEN